MEEAIVSKEIANVGNSKEAFGALGIWLQARWKQHSR